MVDEVRVEVLDLLLRELDVVEPGDDLVVGEEPLLEPLLDEALQLLDLGEGDIDGQHGLGLSPLALERILTFRHALSRPACRPGSTTKRADTRPEQDDWGRGPTC